MAVGEPKSTNPDQEADVDELHALKEWVTDELEKRDQRIADLEEENSQLKDLCNDLVSQTNDLDGRLKALSARTGHIMNHTIGERGIPAALADLDDADAKMELEDDLWTRINRVEQEVSEHEERFQKLGGDPDARNTPDERALILRQYLYTEAKDVDEEKGRKRVDTAEANAALQGGHSRATLLDAMRRTADGKEADINGSSSLDPVKGITFKTGSGKGNPSYVKMDLAEIRDSDFRKNLTTENTREGV